MPALEHATLFPEAEEAIAETLKQNVCDTSHVEMLEFRIGDRVTFQPPGQGPLEGMLTRYNKKTVTVITDTGQTWNVSPTLLSRIKPAKGANTAEPKVVPLNKR
ncbi:hypothetical protein KBI52_07455 [Microvirga sp. HBU67558]|uniref:hypothetical protein n=1 Tax=Microvirga TaxID=186650 RepID=UPI001AEE2714|nr:MULTISPECIES: hypothetical protein [unclassified Microvirga]MBQ0820049.1 hypothetical protein [Microvirga sp. HBU67558]